MALSLWRKGAMLIKNSSNQLIACDKCPCDEGCHIHVRVVAWADFELDDEGIIVGGYPADVNVINHIDQSSNVNIYGVYIDCIEENYTYTFDVNIKCDRLVVIGIIEVLYKNSSGFYGYGVSSNREENTEFTFRASITPHSNGYTEINVDKN